MIILNIRERGHLIEIPGMASFRTPATVDISKGDVKTIVGYLKVCDITDYEIIASNDSGVRETYNSKDFSNAKTKKSVKQKIVKPDKKIEKRMNRMEKMIEAIYKKSTDDSPKKVEQKTNQTEQFQKQMLDAIKKLNTGGNISEIQDSEDDDIAPFIPEIDTEGMKLTSQDNMKTVKKDEDTDDAADALSKLLK
jgi:hypothetical protein